MHKQVNVQALVLYSRPLGEGDRLLTLYTRDLGKISAVAPGARKMKSKLAAAVELFSRGQFLLYRGRSMYTVTQAAQEGQHQAIRQELKLYACGLYLAELVTKAVEENEANPAIFELLLESWQHLETGKTKPALLARFFELKLLDLLGYRPHLDGCAGCGKCRGAIYWSDKSGGILCADCGPGDADAFSLSRGTCALAQYLLKAKPGRLASLRVEVEQHKELKRLVQSFYQYWTDIGSIKSAAFLEEIT